MKILVFTSLYPNQVWPNHGIFIKERMARFAKRDGCEIKVVAPVPYFPAININWRWKFSQVARREMRDGIEVYHPRYFLTPKVGMALYGWLMFFSVLPVVQKLRKDFKFDLIDAHYVYPDGFAAVQLGRLFKRPVVVSARGSDVNLYRTFPLIRKLLQYVLRNAAGVIAVSDALKQSIVGLGIPEKKILTIPNGVDTKKFYATETAQARDKLGLHCSKLMLSVGNLTANKGFDLLIRALPFVSARLGDKNLQLVIVGEGAFRGELETIVSRLGLHGRVRLVGAVAHEELHLWYSAADVFCLASEREGWPNVILESLACGTPVVATKVGGIPEIVQSMDVGILTTRDEQEIARALWISLNKTWHSGQIVNYVKRYSWEHTASAVRDVFDSIINSKSRTVEFSATEAKETI
jgi:glycosyltransferase involved in cell wall biosynthesis